MSANAVDQGATGAAGGALTGTYPNPGLAGASVASALSGQTVSGSLTIGGTLVAGTITATPSLATISPGGVNVAGFVDVTAVGKGLAVAEGANAKQGTAILAAGTVTVANTSVTANSRIIVGLVTLGTVTVPSALGVTSRVAGTSFVILASQATDTSTVWYEIFEPG